MREAEHRGTFGDERPAGLAAIFPPAVMASHSGLRPLKAWRWVGVFGPQVMLCAARVRVGPARQSFYAAWDRRSRRWFGRTGRVEVTLGTGRLQVADRDVLLDLQFTEGAGVETITGATWTRKQAGLAVCGRAVLGGESREITGLAIIDDSAGYHPRHTAWRWSAGVGSDSDGRGLAWNLAAGVHPRENTLWVDGSPQELAVPTFAANLSAVDGLTFCAEAERAADVNRLIVKSRYRQPFGTFAGQIGEHRLAEGFGVMEEHDALW